MSRVAIMQPYLLPYAGYFQLVQTVDTFILLDDVQYIRRGWINRNRILLHRRPQTFTLPVARHPRATPIRDIRVADEAERNLSQIGLSIRHAYKGKPGWSSFAEPVVEYMEKIEAGEPLLPVLQALLNMICAQLGIRANFVLSSEIDIPPCRGIDRVLALARAAGADSYINPIGGTDLYQDHHFHRAGISLSFLFPDLSPYPQDSHRLFIPNLSILDLLAHHDASRGRAPLGQGQLMTRAQARAALQLPQQACV